MIEDKNLYKTEKECSDIRLLFNTYKVSNDLLLLIYNFISDKKDCIRTEQEILSFTKELEKYNKQMYFLQGVLKRLYHKDRYEFDKFDNKKHYKFEDESRINILCEKNTPPFVDFVKLKKSDAFPLIYFDFLFEEYDFYITEFKDVYNNYDISDLDYLILKLTQRKYV